MKVYLELSMSGHAGERNDVTDVFEAGDEHDEALEAHTEASMGHGAVAAQVGVPPDVRGLHAALHATLLQHLQHVLSVVVTWCGVVVN